MNDRYEDFALRIVRLGEKTKNEQYVIMIDSAPIGDTDLSTNFKLPIDQERIKTIREKFEEVIKSHEPGSSATPLPIRDEMREIGEQLFNALMNHKDIKNVYEKNLAFAIGKKQGFRLRLRIDRTLANLPWEFLYDPQLIEGGDGFFILNPYISIARYVPAWYFRDHTLIDGPVRILVVIANPQSDQYTAIDVEAERNCLETSLQPLIGNRKKLVEIDYLEKESTLPNLTAKLRDNEYHVIHYIGHGDYDLEKDRAFLILEGRKGQPVNADASMLIRALDPGMSSLRLVMLNSCKGAVAPVSEAFAGIALSLVRYGVPAVVAMQTVVTDIAAQEFSGQFYTELMSSGSIDKALLSARTGLASTYVDTVEWATPVLYLGTTNGMLFDITDEKVKIINNLKKELQDDEDLYKQAQEIFKRNNLEEALQLFKQIETKRSGFRDVSKRIEEIEKELKKRELYNLILLAKKEKAYRRAWGLFQELEAISPVNQFATLNNEIQTQMEHFDKLYRDGLTALVNNNFQQAVDYFTKLEIEDPEYPDLQIQINEARNGLQVGALRQQLSQKYAETIGLEKDGKWQEATQLWRELDLMAGKFYQDNPSEDVENLWNDAQENVNYGDLYAQIQDSFNKEKWQKVINLCTELLSQEESYRDVDRLLKTAREELKKVEGKNRQKLSEFYLQLQNAEKKCDWKEVIYLGQEIEKINFNYLDVVQKVKKARDIVETAKLIQISNVDEEELFEDASIAYKEHKWDDVIEKCQRILQQNPNHQEALKLQKEAQEVLETFKGIRIFEGETT